MTDARPLAAALWDDSIPVAEDFYHHVNARWLAANPVPAEYPMWGAYVELDHRNKELTRRLLEEAAAAGPDGDFITRLVGDFYASGMDEAAIAAAGAEPLRPYLDRIDAIASVEDLRAFNLDLHRAGLGALFGIGVEADFEDAEVYLAYLAQSGLGLPERGYYLNEDERSVALRGAYTAHIATQFRNLGADEASAAATAEAMLAFERRLAEASLSPEQKRDPAAHDEPALRWRSSTPSCRATAWAPTWATWASPAPRSASDNPGFLAELDRALADTPLDVLRDVPALAPGAARPPRHWPRPSRRSSSRSTAASWAASRSSSPAGSGSSASASSDIGEAVAQLFVRETFPPEAKARVEAMVDHLLAAMAPGDPRQRLDDRGHA